MTQRNAASSIVISERPTFLRERTGKMYRTSAYYFSKLVVDFPFELLWPTIFGSIVYFSVTTFISNVVNDAHELLIV